jgi:hypothetical protein
MDILFSQKIKSFQTIAGIFILALGALNLVYNWIPVLAPYSLFITGLLAFIVTFGFGSIKTLVAHPIHPIKNFFIFLFLILIVSGFVSIFLSVILHLPLATNPISDNTPWLQLPFMILGEELISFFIFILIANKLRYYRKHLLIATIGSAIIFALLHVPTYWSGYLLPTLIHVMFLQGLSRIVFNSAGVRSNTILIPWLVHFVFDILMLMLGGLAK